MSYKTKTGTYPNRSGIPQIPAGSRSLPQSYLNGIGRNIDAVRVNWQHAIGTKQTAGGLQLEELHKDSLYSHPFKVEFVGMGEGGFTAIVTIREGRVHGRIDSAIASYINETPAFNVPSLGVNSVRGINTDEAESPKLPDVEPEGDTNTGTNGSGTTGTENGTYSTGNKGGTGSTGSTGSGTSSTTTVGGPGKSVKGVYNDVNYSAGVYHQGLMKSQFVNKSGNAGSITGNTSGSYYSSGSYYKGGSYYSGSKSGNSASVTGNTGSTFHTYQASGNAGTIINPTQ